MLKIGDPKIKIYHHPDHCDGNSGEIFYKAVDQDDVLAFDEFGCAVCNDHMATHWFSAEFSDWIADRYITVHLGACECGSATALGIEPYAIGHSWWCPVAQ